MQEMSRRRAASAGPESGDPVISVDSKKREKAGNFGQDGRERAPAGDPVTVRSRDFPDRRQAHAYPVRQLRRERATPGS